MRSAQAALVAAAWLTLSFLGSALAAEQPQITGIFSDLRQSKETQDLDGTEILIVAGSGSPSGYYTFYQFWEGGSLPPVVVPITERGGKISFSVPAPSGECGYYEGVITAKGFDGACRIPHPSDATKEVRFHLPRKARSFWQSFEVGH